MATTAMSADVIPRGSSPSPGPVTSLFYRIGRPRPEPVYTSQQTAAGVSFPSWWTGIGWDEKGVEGTGCRYVLLWIPSRHQLDWVIQCGRKTGRLGTVTRSSRCSSQCQWAEHCGTLYCGANQWALRSAAGGRLNLSWWMASWCGRGTSGRKCLSSELGKTCSPPLHFILLFPFISSLPICSTL